MTHCKNIENKNKEAYVSTSTYLALEDLKNKLKLGETEKMQKSSSSSLEVQVSVRGCNVTVRGNIRLFWLLWVLRERKKARAESDISYKAAEYSLGGLLESGWRVQASDIKCF